MCPCCGSITLLIPPLYSCWLKDSTTMKWLNQEQMDTLGIEPRASRMLSGADTITPRALAVTQHTHDLKTKDAGNTEQLVCARQWAWCQILRVAIVPMATRVDVEKWPLQSVDSTWGTWCSGITSAPHVEGPGFKSQCVHAWRCQDRRPTSNKSSLRWAAVQDLVCPPYDQLNLPGR